MVTVFWIFLTQLCPDLRGREIYSGVLLRRKQNHMARVGFSKRGEIAMIIANCLRDHVYIVYY